MTTTPHEAIATTCREFGHDRTRLLDILEAVERRLGHVPEAAVDAIAGELGMPRVDVAGVVSFYSFLSAAPRGRVVIRLCDDVPDRLLGADGLPQDPSATSFRPPSTRARRGSAAWCARSASMRRRRIFAVC